MKRFFCAFVLLVCCTAAFGDELSTPERVVNEPVAIEAAEPRCALSPKATIGIVRGAAFRVIDQKRVQISMDPTCEEECDRIYAECIDRCDPRGDSCARCVDDYNTCHQYCP